MAILTVGPVGRQFTTIAKAVAAAAAGDTVQVDGGAAITYTNDFIYVNKTLTLQAVGGMVHMVATVQPPNQKAMIIAGVKGTAMTITINGFDVSGVKVGDQNGAAVRYEGANLHLNDVYFHDNQEGILGNADATGSIAINHSEFDHNGFSTGFSHNIYVGQIASFSLTNSYVHDAIVGHEVKSRALNNVITGNRIFDNNGSASYSIDLPNAGNAQITSNIIEQGANSENPYIIAYGEEGASNLGRTVSIAGNTIVNDMATGRGVLNRSTTALPYSNNKEYHSGIDTGPLVDTGTLVLATRPTLDTAHMKFIIGGTPPPPPPPPPVGSSDPVLVAAYHTDVWNDFSAYASTHPSVLSDTKALGALQIELASKTVLLTPPPGDLWS